MSRSNDSPGERLSAQWARLSPLPGGKWLFSRMLGLMVPYTGTIRSRVEQLDPGHVRIRLDDRRRVRNHLRSIHAIALTNLGELTTGLALTGALPSTVRGIPVRIQIDFLKKARGTLEAESKCDIPTVEGDVDEVVEATIRDASGDTVAIVQATWRLSPVPASA